VLNNKFADKKIFLSLFTVNFCISFGFCMTDSFFSVYYKNLGAEGLLIGMSAASYQIAKVILAPVFGKIADDKSYFYMALTGIMLYIFVAASYLSVHNIYFLILLRVVQGTACAAFKPVIYTIFNSKIRGNKQSEAFGTFDISFYSALAAGPLVGGFLHDAFGITGIFYSVFALSLIALLAYIPLHGKCSTKKSKFEKEIDSRRFTKTEIAMYVFIFGKASTLACFTIFFPIYLMDGGLSSTHTGFILSCSAIGMCIFMKPMGWLADISSKSLMIIVGGSVISAMYLCLPEHISLFSASVFSFFCGFFGAVSQPAGMSLIMGRSYSGKNASVLGIFNSVMSMGFIFGSILSSLIVDRFGIHQAFAIVGLFSLSSLFLFAVIIKEDTSQHLMKQVR